jgi:hypothetical protein
MTEQEENELREFVKQSAKAHAETIEVILSFRRDLDSVLTIIHALTYEVSRLKGSKIIINGGGPKAEA